MPEKPTGAVPPPNKKKRLISVAIAVNVAHPVDCSQVISWQLLLSQQIIRFREKL